MIKSAESHFAQHGLWPLKGLLKLISTFLSYTVFMFHMEACSLGPSEEEMVSQTQGAGGLGRCHFFTRWADTGWKQLIWKVLYVAVADVHDEWGWQGSVLSTFFILDYSALEYFRQHKRLNDHTARQKLKGAARRNVSCAGHYTNHQENSICLWGRPQWFFLALVFSWLTLRFHRKWPCPFISATSVFLIY